MAQALPFADDFEDGDFAGWIVERGGGRREVSGQTAANGTSYSYREFESLGSHYSGVYTTLGDVRPGYFGFWVRPGNTSHNTGYFAVTSPDGYESIFFFARESGRFYVNGDTGGDESYVYEPYTWYLIEFRNVDFTAKTFDYWVNGEPVATGIRFRYPSSAVSAQTLRLYNYSYGAEAHWDEIPLADAPPTHWITSRRETGPFPLGRPRASTSVWMRPASTAGGTTRGSSWRATTPTSRR